MVYKNDSLMNKEELKIEIRECGTLEELLLCQKLQQNVFGISDMEVSPVRHLVVTRSAGGFILGAFDGQRLVGFVLSVPGFTGEKRFFYSHMTAVAKDFQNFGIGARLKWAQRDFSLAQNVDLIKWTFQPILARNAHFNLNRLGATIKRYVPNFYGTDYYTSHLENGKLGLDSDRLYADWNLNDEKVVALAKGETFEETGEVVQKVEIPNDWSVLFKNDLPQASASNAN
jgi:predicted GNAT superfamily acetyltransferase